MDLNSIPLFAMLKGKLVHTSERQKIISENVANADVPNYAPRDLKPFSFSAALQQPSVAGNLSTVATVRTAPAHISVEGPPLPPPSDAIGSPDSETRLDGNRVVLEEQMVKLTEARMDYDAAVGFYQQSLGLLKMAISKPGQG